MGLEAMTWGKVYMLVPEKLSCQLYMVIYC